LKSFILIFLCASISLQVQSQTQQGAVKGQLYLIAPETNFSHQGQHIPYNGVPLEIFIHELTSPAEVDIEDGIIKKIYTPVVTRIFSKWNGGFKAKLPAGNYSFFVRYQNGFYGNLKDASGNLSPVFVPKKKQAWITIVISYASYY